MRTPTINWHSRRESFVIILLCWFPGRKSVLLEPPSYTRDCPLATAHQTQTTESKRGIAIGQATHERGSVSPLPPNRHHPRPASRTGSSTFSNATASPSPLSKQLFTSSSTSGGSRALELWRALMKPGSVLSGEAASNAGLNATQTH